MSRSARSSPRSIASWSRSIRWRRLARPVSSSVIARASDSRSRSVTVIPPRAIPATTVTSASAPATSLNVVNWPIASTVSAATAETMIAASTV